jgi:membrane protease subunit (stomatin/prohibitin family)
MGIFDKIKGEFIDIVEWLDDSTDVMVHRFERHNNEIKNGAKLVVRESQVAVLIDEGQLADVFPPGTYTLETQNMPILSTLRGWKYGFNSPFKVEVYFVNTKRFTDQKWGTANPIMMRDMDFGIVRVRAFGTYSMRVIDAGLFLKEVVGTNLTFTTEDINKQTRSFLVSGFSDAVAEQKIPVLDLAAQYEEMGSFLTEKIKPKFAEHGLDLLNMTIENISVPPEVEAAIDQRSKMGALGDMTKYTQMKAAESLTENPGGMGAMGAQMAAGMMMGQTMAGSMVSPAAAGAPPPIPQATQYFVAVNGAQQGPYDASAISGMASRGELSRESLVWSNGMAAWTKAGDVAELSGAFAAVPPPLPPQ